MKKTTILAIETSCDETSIALLESNGDLRAPKFNVLKNIVSSQIAVHRPFGGVVPNLAKREHLKNLPIIFNQILGNRVSKLTKSDFVNIDIVAVTVGPGLEPALWTGIEFAKKIHAEYFPKTKLIGVNHMEGHLYSFLLTQKTGISNFQFLISNEMSNSKFQILHPPKFSKKIWEGKHSKFLFPAVGLVVSGGHTILILLKNLTTWKKLGETRDDAVGEAFDKVARILELPYPGGPEIQKIAIYGSPTSIDFPRPMMYVKNYDFSFSGLKTSVLYYLKNNSYESIPISSRTLDKVGAKKYENTKNNSRADIAASFQKAAIDVLVYKTMRAVREFGAQSVILVGGVAANKLLRGELNVKCEMLNVNFLAPDMKFNTDNAAMIGAAAYISILKKQKRPLKLVAQGNLSL